MHPSDHLSTLEAQAFANTRLITALSLRNDYLRVENAQQERLIKRFEEEIEKLEDLETNGALGDDYSGGSLSTISTTSKEGDMFDSDDLTPSSPHCLDSAIPHPDPLTGPIRPCSAPTPFYLTARAASSLELSFVVQGMRGEILTFPVEAVDMAFLLERTLLRRRWVRENAEKSVREWMNLPLVGVEIVGEEMDIGILDA
ncbi:hypothetical protein FB567DRAFT_602276 [Paraphoma chrysanthemicola]|uniref:Uncharacterized protein n=1 Tax=Paraphoma chrysanthemicola TaxID=798071 RepID=A0A8K0R781_9PLEO|nr:hypothetical protein FB567DRAFT_602276 [Paraphoma chrysanthemicola]